MPTQYSLVPHAEEQAFHDEIVEHVEDDSIPSRLRLDTCAAAISLVCAILSFLLYLVPTITVEIPAVQSQTPLPRPNQYIGLDSINRTALNATSPSPIVTYSALLAQFSLAEPAYVYPVMGHDYFERDFGTISPDDKYFAVDQRTSSIAQFRVRDWGMELCHLVLRIPQHVSLEGSSSPSVTLSKPSATLDIWRLATDSSDFIDVHKLSGYTRPPRVGSSPIATIQLTEGTTVETSLFSCQSDSIQTFEFSCTTVVSPQAADCFVNFWQEQHSTDVGVYVVQYASK